MPEWPAMTGLKWQAFLYLILALILCGCAETYLEGPELGRGYVRLAAAARAPMDVQISVPAQEEVIGRQWTLLFIPAGTIRVKDPQQILSVAAFRVLAKHGYRPTISTEARSEALPAATLTFKSFELGCSVPDLFFVRVVRCDVTVTGTFASAPDLTTGGHGESSEFRLVGFKPELEVELEHALDAALDDFLGHMHL